VTLLDDEAWERCWDDFKRSAWRLETQQTYTMPDEQKDLARFLAGEPEERDAEYEEWYNQIRSWAAVGKSISRVRLVRRPLTDYQRYIFAWGVPANVDAGENVRVLDITDEDFGLPAQDFWIFDDSIVVHLNFNADGTLINHELIDEPDMAKYRAWQETALKYSAPFSEWNART
jgi:uncharacterized protein DUF6879